ncbi:hypothetical protein PINS_up006968 [Pythium insidiosum]|nr:hypothetical protein PINS_up006968 [Pythium insidiosum]
MSRSMSRATTRTTSTSSTRTMLRSRDSLRLRATRIVLAPSGRRRSDPRHTRSRPRVAQTMTVSFALPSMVTSASTRTRCRRSNTSQRSSPGTVDFVFHVGDISYADNAGIPTVSSATEFTGFFYEETYNDFMTRMQPLAATTPYMVLPGNHESECHSAACMVSSEKKKQLSNYRAYNARFKMPSAESGGAANMWYSFEHGPVHFTSISSETDFPNAPNNSHIPFNKIPYGGFGDQLSWLERDLQRADANRANVPWVVVMMHRAIYTRTMCDANGVPTGEAAPVQKAFEELFIKYNVDVVVSGHVHLYSRHFPVRRNEAVLDGVSPDFRTYKNPKAPVYLISGRSRQLGGP